MGGHSHWAGIKHKKAIIDAKKGKIWTKLVREITIAAKLGGGNPEGNPRLRKVLGDARAANMPAENIKRAIQKGTGELPGTSYEELTFEGYGPGSVAVYCEGSSDNKNRTTSEIRKIFENHGGSLGSAGCVAYLFEKNGYLVVKKSTIAEDDLLAISLELGAEDFKTQEQDYEIITSPQNFETVRDGLKAKGVPLESADLTMMPKTEVSVGEELAPKILALLSELEDHDDIAHVYANFDIPDKILASLDK
jgi:YebC/PmpR family DNA-binding regulatory protein